MTLVAVRGAETGCAVPATGSAVQLLVLFAGLSHCKVVFYPVCIAKNNNDDQMVCVLLHNIYFLGV